MYFAPIARECPVMECRHLENAAPDSGDGQIFYVTVSR